MSNSEDDKKFKMSTNPPTIPTYTGPTYTGLVIPNPIPLPPSANPSLPPAAPPVETGSIDVRLPQFIPNLPELWFVQAEAIFKLRKTSESSQYYHVLAALPSAVLERVLDIISDPETEKTYNFLKTALLARLTPSEEERINRVLFNMEIGDQRPSDFYRRMVQVAGHNSDMSGKLIFRLWLKRLPKLIECTLIPLETRPVSEILPVADSLFEASKSISVSEVSISGKHLPSQSQFLPSTSSQYSDVPSTTQTVPQVSEIDSMRSEINELKRMIQNLSIANNRGRSRSRGRTNFTGGNTSSRTRSKSRSGSTLCFYHSKFGNKANKCQQPCSFVSSSKPKN